MAMAGPGCRCGCVHPEGADTHAIVAALAIDDLDRALDLGLLATGGCPGCTAGCCTFLTAARDARQRALAARERYRARTARLQRRADERVARRTTVAATTITAPALPPAAAAALARAKARAAERSGR